MSNEEGVFDEPLPHPHGFCIKPLGGPDGMIDSTVEPNKWGFDLTAEYLGGAFNYATCLVSDASRCISSQCGNKIGNKYVFKTGTTCKYNDKSVARYKYINNIDQRGGILTGGRSVSDPGFVESTLNSATSINPMGIVNAMSESIEPECKPVKLKYHYVDRTSANGGRPITGTTSSDKIYMSVDDIAEAVYTKPENIIFVNPEDAVSLGGRQSAASGRGVRRSIVGFENLYENLNNYLNNNSEYFETLNIPNSKINAKNLDNLINHNNLVNIYYLLISILLAYMIFKVVVKK